MLRSSDAPAYGLVDSAVAGKLSRRGMLAGAGFLLAFAHDARRKAHAAAGEEPSLHDIQARTGTSDNESFNGFAPGGFIQISKDHGVVLIIPNVEMGQGIYTAEAMLIAEELEVGLDQIGIKAAPPNEKLYTQPLLKSQSTGGSTSIRGAWVPLRQAGAAARIMLIAAAADQWHVPVEECFAQRASVTNRPSNRSIPYVDLAGAASRQSVPSQVKLKDPKDFQLIGKSAPRLDVPSKVNGSAQFGIDISVPGMKYASVSACPVFGGKLADVDDTAARAIPGVRDVLRISNAVAVTADNFWLAQKGLAALRITWDYGRNASLGSADLVSQLKSDSEHGTPVMARHDGDIDGGFRNAAKRVEAAYELPFLAHATMEPINTLVHVRPDGCDVWVGTQVPAMAQKLAAEAAGLPREKVAELADWGNPLPKGMGRGVALHNAFGSFVAAVVEIEVPPTGEIRLRKVVGVIDCGLTINPDGVNAQIEGGLVFGLTAALYNDVTFHNGRVQQSNFNNYRMMRINETPPFQVEVIQSGESPGGVGETGTVSAAPALGNAIFAATGMRLRRYPFNRNDLQAKDTSHNAVASLVPAAGVAFAMLQPTMTDEQP